MIKLRALEPSDLDLLYRWENDPETWHTTMTPVHVSRARLWQYINEFDGNIDSWQQLRLMITDTALQDSPVGTVDLFDIDRRSGRAFVGIYIDSQYRHQGYGHQALKMLIDYSRDYLNLHQLAAIVEVDNRPSINLFTGLDFKPAGRLRSWLKIASRYRDAIILQRLFI